MNILHLTCSDEGGAGLAVLRLHESLLNIGINSRVLVAEKSSSLDSVIKALPSGHNVYTISKNPLLAKVIRRLRKRGMFLTEIEKDELRLRKIPSSQRTFFTAPISRYEIHKHPLIEWADVIHLHWIEDFIDYPSFFSAIDKPFVWTFHDENIGLGGFHYTLTRDDFLLYYKDLEDKYIDVKRRALSGVKNLTMVALSDEMREFCSSKSFVQKRPIVRIPNSVNFNAFVPVDKINAKSILHIDKGALVFSFCSYELSDPRKGLRELLLALEYLKLPSVVLICIGAGDLPIQTNLKIYKTGTINDTNILSLMYSASDFFVMPSFQEAFAQTPMEALSCGTPVVAFPVSGTSDLINDGNGIRCEDFSVQSLVKGIKKGLETKFDSSQIREDIMRRYSPTIIAKQFISLYEDVINNNR